MEEALALYDRIGVGYDGTRRADPGITARLAALLDLRGEPACLDAACGTGNYTQALSVLGGRWTGVDIAPRMIAEARAKTPAVHWLVGDVAQLPFPDGAFAGALCTLAIHHFPDLGAAFREIARVLRGGRLVLFTSAPEQMRTFWLNEYFPSAMARSMSVMPSLDRVRQALMQAGFTVVALEPWSVPADLVDLFLYSGKHHPELYFSAAVRAGISTFAQHADADEVERGCARLRADLASGRFEAIRRASEGPDGDYAFVIAHA